MNSEPCLACAKRVGWFRRLFDQRFCCKGHERQWMEELKQLSIERLQIACREVPTPPKPTPARHDLADKGDTSLALALANRSFSH
jgi:hypothetical protein